MLKVSRRLVGRSPDLLTRHRVQRLAGVLVGVLIAGLTLTGIILSPAQAANGTMSGTVTEAGTGTPMGGVTVRAFCWQVGGSDQGTLCAETQTVSNGTYSLPLARGVYKVQFDDYPNHSAQFYGGGTTIGSANSSEVTVPDGGAASGINAALQPLRTVTGTVTGNGQNLGGINVTAYRAGGFIPLWGSVGGVVTEPDGSYTLRVTDGTYRVGFSDAHGPYRTEFFDGAGIVEQADDVVVAGSNVGGISADLVVNYPITGTVTVDGLNMPGVTVTAWRADTFSPSGFEAVKTAETGEDGSYALYLPDGTYRIQFQTYQARFPTQYYPGVSLIDFADDVVLAGAEVSNIGAAISTEPGGTGPAITGTVTIASTGAPASFLGVTAWRYNVRAAQWVEVRQGSTGTDGTYELFVPEGTYRIQFIDYTGRYQSVFYGGAATVDDAADVAQPTAGVTGIDAQLVVENHSISGLITADPLPGQPPGPPLTEVLGLRWNAVSSQWEGVNGTVSEPDGRYVLYLPAGTYRIEFNDLSGGYQHPHFYDGSDNIGEATDVVLADADVTGIDTHLIRVLNENPLPWSPPKTLSSAGQNAWGPQVAVGTDGTATAVWYRWDGSNNRVQASLHAPHQPWSSPTVLSAAGQDAIDPQVAVGADGIAVAVWRQWDGTHYRVQATTGAANGSWSSPMTVSGADGDAWDPQVVVGKKGVAVAVWRRAAGSVSQVQASTRFTKGSWSSPVALSEAGGDAWDPQVALGWDGTAVAVWSRSDGTNYRVQATAQESKGAWSSPVTLSAAGVDAESPQVAVGPDGTATAVWRGWDGSNERVQSASQSSRVAWSTPTSLSLANRDAHDPQLAVDSHGVMTAVWSRYDGSSNRVQTASRVPGATWSTPKSLSRGGKEADTAQVAAGPGGTATVLWHQTDGFSALVLATIRRADGSWSNPTQLIDGNDLNAQRPQVAVGSDGTVAGVWERQIEGYDRVQGVVRFDPGGPNHCQNEFGVDVNILFGVPEQFAAICPTVTAGSSWRSLALWTTNTVFEQVPPGFVPAAATPLEDLVAKLKSITVVVDRDTKRQRTTVFAPSAALRTDLTFDEFDPFESGHPMAVTIPKMVALRAGTHTVQVIWTLTAQHCDGLGDVEAFNCLASGDNSLGTRTFTVGSP